MDQSHVMAQVSSTNEKNSAACAPLFHRFFDLPGELRNKVLKLLLVHPYGVTIGTNGSFVRLCPWGETNAGDDGSNLGGDIEQNVLPLSLLLSNSKLADEAEAIFYTENFFYAKVKTRRPAKESALSASLSIPKPEPKELLGRHNGYSSDSDDDDDHRLEITRPRCRNLMGSDARFKIRKLVLIVQRFGGPLGKEVVPALQDLILRGSLRWLEVRFDNQTTSRHAMMTSPSAAWQPDNDAVGGGGSAHRSLKKIEKILGSNEAFLAVLRLLSDPDLTVARASVPQKEHSPLWCQFHGSQAHDPASGCEQVVSTTCRDYVDDSILHQAAKGPHATIALTAPGWLELDLKAMLRKFKGEDAKWWNI